MPKVSEVMTRDVAAIAPNESLRRAAEMMDRLNVGVLPVCTGSRLQGMITDRDIVVRAVSAGKSPEATTVEEVMTIEVEECFEDSDVREAERRMRDLQVRRLPVISRDRDLVGIVALGDLATEEAPGVKATLKEISEPSKPDR